MRCAKLPWLLSAFFWGVEAVAIEEPDYEVIAATTHYELRRYEAFIVAETEVPGEFDAVGSDAFRLLAGYIFGNNRASSASFTQTRSVSDEAGVKMAMTAPVISTAPGAREMHTYRFVMPSEFQMKTLPIPIDSRVKIRELPPRVVAVRRYSGRWTPKRFQSNETALREALARDDIKIKGEAIFARYNAPYTPWFMRRNEVMFEIEQN